MNFNNKNNVALLLIILGAIIFFMFVLPVVDNNYYQNIKENFNASIANNDNLVKIDKNKCSRDCCGLSQWPVPSDMLSNTIPSDELKNYIPSNFSCNLGNNIGSGCVCLTQKDSDYLNNHGNNSHITQN